MSQLPKIEDVIHTLFYHLAAGTAHMVVAKGLAESDPVVLSSANVFFSMTIDAHLYSSLMYAARVHDNHRNAVTVKTLLKRVKTEASKAKYGTQEDVNKAIHSAERILRELGEPLRRLNARRNHRLAHTDPRTLTNPSLAIQEMQKDSNDLNAIFEKTAKILNEFSRLYRSIYAVPKIIGQDDYETVVGYVAEAKCDQFRNYAKKFGTPPFPRPKNCR